MDYNHPYARLTPDLVLAAVESLGFQPDARIFALNSYENRVYQIGLIEGGSIVVKFYRPERWTADQIYEEHCFAQELSDLEIPVVPPLPVNEGGTLHSYENFQLAAFPLLIGRPPELDNLDNLLVMGRFIGRIHAVGVMKNFKQRAQISVEKFAIDSRRFLLENDFIPMELIPAYESLSQDLINRVQQRFDEHGALNLLRIHGDCHPGNILWKDNMPNFVDFDDTMMGPAMQELDP